MCTASTERLTNYQPNLSTFFGPGSIFALDGRRHHDRRRLLAPAFHGKSLKDHEEVIVDETLRESANWPENKEFRIFEPMNRITLNVILRTIFGAEGTELETLRGIVPRYAKFGSAMVKFMRSDRRLVGVGPLCRRREPSAAAVLSTSTRPLPRVF